MCPPPSPTTGHQGLRGPCMGGLILLTHTGSGMKKRSPSRGPLPILLFHVDPEKQKKIELLSGNGGRVADGCVSLGKFLDSSGLQFPYI